MLWSHILKITIVSSTSTRPQNDTSSSLDRYINIHIYKLMNTHTRVYTYIYIHTHAYLLDGFVGCYSHELRCPGCPPRSLRADPGQLGPGGRPGAASAIYAVRVSTIADLAVSVNSGFFKKGFRAPRNRFGADTRQVESLALYNLDGCFYTLLGSSCALLSWGLYWSS